MGTARKRGCAARKGKQSYMATEIKIISNPYTQTVNFETRPNRDVEWKPLTFETDPNSELLKDRFARAYFLEQAEAICRLLLAEYGQEGQSLNLYFEGIATEYYGFRVMLAHNKEFADINLQSPGRQMVNAEQKLTILNDAVHNFSEDIQEEIGEDRMRYVLRPYLDNLDRKKMFDSFLSDTPELKKQYAPYPDAQLMEERFIEVTDSVLQQLASYMNGAQETIETHTVKCEEETIEFAPILSETEKAVRKVFSDLHINADIDYSNFMKAQQNIELNAFAPEDLMELVIACCQEGTDEWTKKENERLEQERLKREEAERQAQLKKQEEEIKKAAEAARQTEPKPAPKKQNNNLFGMFGKALGDIGKFTGIDKVVDDGVKKVQDLGRSWEEAEKEKRRRKAIQTHAANRFDESVNSRIVELLNEQATKKVHASAGMRKGQTKEIQNSLLEAIDTLSKLNVEQREVLRQSVIEYCENTPLIIEEGTREASIGFPYKVSAGSMDALKNLDHFDGIRKDMDMYASAILKPGIKDIKAEHSRLYEEWFDNLETSVLWQVNALAPDMSESVDQIETAKALTETCTALQNEISETRENVRKLTDWRY